MTRAFEIETLADGKATILASELRGGVALEYRQAMAIAILASLASWQVLNEKGRAFERGLYS